MCTVMFAELLSSLSDVVTEMRLSSTTPEIFEILRMFLES